MRRRAGGIRLGPAPGKVSRPFWLLVLLTGSGTAGIHVFAPILPLVAAEFAVSAFATQLTISLYMLALAVGQVIYGPVSDRFGRRPVLIAGLAVYVAAGVLAAVAPTFPLLLAARVLQALGGCAGLTLGRAIIQDTARGADAASTMAAVNMAILLTPTVAPLVGIWLAELAGWRAVPALLSVIGTVGLAGAVLLLSETATRPAGTVRLRQYAALLGDPAFLATIVGGGLTTAVLFALLSVSPFVFVESLGRPASEVGYYYAVFVLGIIFGSVVANRLVRTAGFDNLITGATLVGSAAGGAMLVLALTGDLSLPAFLATGFLFTTMAGIMGPLSLTLAAGRTERFKGSATGIYGFGQMAIGSTCVLVAGAGADASVSLAAVLAFCSVCGFVIFAVMRLLGHGGGPDVTPE